MTQLTPIPFPPMAPEAADLPIRPLYNTRYPVCGWENGGHRKYPRVHNKFTTSGPREACSLVHVHMTSCVGLHRHDNTLMGLCPHGVILSCSESP